MTSRKSPPEAGAAQPAWRFLVPAGIVELACLAAAGWWPGGAPSVVLIPLLGLAFVAYAYAASRVMNAFGGHRAVWVFAIAMRVVLLPLLPDLSHDLYRYLWDGHLQLSGVNPYRFVPNDPHLVGLRTPVYDLLPDQRAPTPFPPADQIVFLLLALAGGAVLQAKLLWVGLDLTTGWVLGRVAAFTGRSRRLTQLLYLWSPLLVVEVAWNGHMVPLVMLALALVILLARAPAAAGMAAAVATLTTWSPIASLIPLGARLGRRFAVGCIALLAALTVPYLGAGTQVLAGMARHFGLHRMFEGPFLLIESVVPSAAAAHVVTGTCVLAVLAWTTARRFRPERTLFWTLGIVLIVTPELRAWYVLWILPMAALRVSRSWLLFTGLALLTYAGVDGYRETGTWPQPLWVRLALWLPFLALLGWEALTAWRRRFPPTPGRPVQEALSPPRSRRST